MNRTASSPPGAYLVLDRGPGRCVAVTLAESPDGYPRLDARTWVQAVTGWSPTHQGVRVRPSELARFIDALKSAADEARRLEAETSTRKAATP